NVGNLRSYDVWGAVRSGATTGGPSGRYVANLGHVQDDESGLIYMRARYYEPGTGRFVSEDPARDGFNWFVYASNSPTLMLDFNGRTASMSSGTILWLQFLVVGGTAGLLGFGVLAGVMALDPANGVYSAWCCTVAVAAMGIAMSNFTTLVVGDDSNRNALVGSFSSLASQAITIVLATYSAIMTMMIEGMGVAGKSPAGPALAGLFAQTLLQIGALVSMDIDSVQGFW
ncbi:MAG: RHS repeat-associated core domain-containing protein, partial [Fimbriimonadaceae bacterium]|nr:RHS repeat-associated core domain-containing protein [Fimbriimonadaceae bacterium]